MDDYLKGMVEPPPDQDPHGTDGHELGQTKRTHLTTSGDQPSPAPTREEWEAWAEKIARRITWAYGCPPLMTDDVKAELLSMPIVPRGK